MHLKKTSNPISVEPGKYGIYRVVDTVHNGRKARILFGDNLSPQSGMALDDDPEMLFHYNQRFLEIAMSLQPKRVLVIGGGVMMLPKGLLQLFPKTKVDAIEIDEAVVDIAQRFFDLPSSRRFNIHTIDGIDYLKSTHKTYDLIIVDAFHGYQVPEHLVDADAAALYSSHLRRKGVVAFNIISSHESNSPSLASHLVGSLNTTFTYTEVYPADTDDPLSVEQNLIITASDIAHNFDYLQSSAA